MDKVCLLSLCIPTNGIIEWVLPVLDSIYSDNNDLAEFEVIVTDNGNNAEFQKKMYEYQEKFSNLIFKKTEAPLFLNQIEAFKLATGQMLKFINHRTPVLPGAIEYLIQFAKKNKENRPVVFFSNGQLNLNPQIKECISFDAFVKTLSYWSSWSAGTSIWKNDFIKMELNGGFNQLFPHTDIVFYDKKCNKYIVDDTPLFKEISSDSTKKGNYDLFHAFAVEYPAIIDSLFQKGDISKETFDFIIKENGEFISKLYYQFILLKKPCSYKLKGYRKSFGYYYSEFEIVLKAFMIGMKKMKLKILKKNNH